MKLPTKEELKPLGYSALLLFAGAVIGAMMTPTSFKGMFSLSFAVFFYLIVPGYFVMLNFSYSALERVIIGMVVSIAVVPGLLYGINMFGLKLSFTNIFIIIIVVTVASVLYRKNKPKPQQS